MFTLPSSINGGSGTLTLTLTLLVEFGMFCASVWPYRSILTIIRVSTSKCTAVLLSLD